MKYLIATIAALVLVGCGNSQPSTPTPEAKTVKPAEEATDHSVDNKIPESADGIYVKKRRQLKSFSILLALH